MAQRQVVSIAFVSAQLRCDDRSRGGGTRGKHRASDRHSISGVRLLECHHVGIVAGLPAVVIVVAEDCDRGLWIDRRDQYVRIAGYYGEIALIANLTPDPGDREDGLIDDIESHLALDRLFTIAAVNRLWRRFAELGQRDQAPIFGSCRQRLPLRHLDVAGHCHWPRRLFRR